MNTHARFVFCIRHDHIPAYTLHMLYMSQSHPNMCVKCVVYFIITSRYIRYMCCVCHDHIPTPTLHVLYVSWSHPDIYVLCVSLFMSLFIRLWRAHEDRKNHIADHSHYFVCFFWYGMIKYHNTVYWDMQIENYTIVI